MFSPVVRRKIKSPRAANGAGQKRNREFIKTVLGFYTKSGRGHLPWRKTKDPYKILVSEVMLQQTQVDRVTPYYKKFLKKFPTVRALSRAPLSDVLREWQGLGYNRRAKMLHEAAKEIVSKHKGIFPRTKEALVALSGVGPYTASAVRVFAFNEPDLLLETNIRAVYLHHFFPKNKKVHDREVVRLTVQPRDTLPREWNWALMDYGSFLKRTLPNPSRRSAHHLKQKPFKGSDREIRGAILKAALTGNSITELPFPVRRIRSQASALVREGLIVRHGKGFWLPD